MEDTRGAFSVPFNRPSIEGSELELMLEAVRDGHISAGGAFTARVAHLLTEELGAADVLLTTSCTDALEMAALLLDLGPGDIVIVPSFTFVSTALAFARTGARLRFADIERDTLGLDPDSVAAHLDERVRAVVPVHYAGVGCEIDRLRATLADSEAALIEDNAHGLFGRYRGQALGSFGRFSALSFHETKNFICGEGGALVLNDGRDIDRAHTLLDKGTNRRSFFLGEVDKYTWVDTGSSFGLSDLLAAFLLGQLQARDQVLVKRQRVAERYAALLTPLEGKLEFQCMKVPDDRTQAYHMFYVLFRSRLVRDRVLESLNKQGVHATFHYIPLHSAPAAAQFSDGLASCPVTDEISGWLMRLPFYNGLEGSEIEEIVDRFAVRQPRHWKSRMDDGALAHGISIVVPVYRGSSTLPDLHRRLDAVLTARGDRYELILVDDGSPDDSWKTITKLASEYCEVRGFRLGRNYGQHAALLAGIRAARFPIIVTIDDDLQNPPEELPNILSALVDGVDVVYGVPTVVQEDVWRRLAGRLARWSLKVSGVRHAPSVSSFRAFRTDLRRAFDVQIGPAVAIDSLLAWATTRFASVEVVHAEREVGVSNYTAQRLLIFAIDFLTGYSTLPLRIATFLGLVTSGFGVALLIYVFVRVMISGDAVVGFPFLASTIVIFSGVQLIMLGMIGEYIGRIHFRMMGKPSYAILSSTDAVD